MPNVNENEPMLNKSCWKVANSLSGGIINILINNQTEITNENNGNI